MIGDGGIASVDDDLTKALQNLDLQLFHILNRLPYISR